jgi:hypothetical protein
MTDQIFTPEQEAELEALARRRGFTELRAYIYALVERDAEQHGEVSSLNLTLDELMAMPLEERDIWLEKAAALAEELYRNDPELTITADTIDLYDYPDAE